MRYREETPAETKDTRLAVESHLIKSLVDDATDRVRLNSGSLSSPAGEGSDSKLKKNTNTTRFRTPIAPRVENEAVQPNEWAIASPKKTEAPCPMRHMATMNPNVNPKR